LERYIRANTRGNGAVAQTVIQTTVLISQAAGNATISVQANCHKSFSVVYGCSTSNTAIKYLYTKVKV